MVNFNCLPFRWSCPRDKVCGQRNFNERKAATTGGTLWWIFVTSFSCKVLFSYQSLLIDSFCVLGTGKETETERRSQEKTWSRKGLECWCLGNFEEVYFFSFSAQVVFLLLTKYFTYWFLFGDFSLGPSCFGNLRRRIVNKHHTKNLSSGVELVFPSFLADERDARMSPHSFGKERNLPY